MLVFLSGQFVPEAQAVVSVFDRGFLYGDGLFETLRVVHGQPFRWDDHWQRLQHGAEWLKLTLPWASAELRTRADELIRRNQLPDAVLRLQISRGPGPRGYSLREAGSPTVLMTLHPAPAFDREDPPGWRLATASQRVWANDPLTHVKTCNKLPWILARAEAEAQGADAALLLNTAGEVAEADCANIFWIERGGVCTPPLSSGALPGVTRNLVIDLCRQLNLRCEEKPVRPEQLASAEGAFLTLSTLGIVTVASIDQHPFAEARRIGELRQAYGRVVAQET